MEIMTIRPKRKHFFLTVVVLGVLMFFMSRGSAVNCDEIVHNRHARNVVDWYFSGGENMACLRTPITNLKYYGQSIDNLAALLNRAFSLENEFRVRHYLGFVISLILIIVTGQIAFELSSSYFVGILAMLLLFISPRFMGQAYGNLKDIPFAMGYAWAILEMVRLLKQMPVPHWKNVISLALAIAFTASIRIGGVVLFFYAFLFFCMWLWYAFSREINNVRTMDFWMNIVLKGAVIILVGYFGALFFWPYGLMDSFRNPIEALRIMEHYKVSIKQIFEGIVFWSTDLPWYYLPKWLLISVPEVILLGLASMLFLMLKKGKELYIGHRFLIGVVAFVILFPVTYVIAVNSNLYSGWRQMYFIYPPIVVLSAIGIARLLQTLKSSQKNIVLVLIVLFMCLPLVHTAKTYPSEYIYFNTLVGNNKSAWGNYEYDYYWHEMKKAAEWLDNEIDLDTEKVIVASNLDLTPYLYQNKNIEFKYVHFYDKISIKWDYAILGNNYVHPYQLKKGNWIPINVSKTFYHKGNPTVVAIKGQDSLAFSGYRAFKEGRFANAIVLLRKALINDPGELNVIAYLAESYLATDYFPEALGIVEGGLLLHPDYEPFLLLKAKISIKQKDYTRGLRLLSDLLRINPKYYKAYPYWIECYESTGQLEKARKLKEKYQNKYNQQINKT